MSDFTLDTLETIIAALDLDEKAALTAGVDMWHATGNERLGIRGLKVSRRFLPPCCASLA